MLTYIESLKPEMYELAIRMFFNLFLRIGELKALKWEDVDWEKREIYVHRQLLIEPGYTKNMHHAPRKHVESDLMKGYTSSGYRHEYLTDEAMEILKMARELNLEGEYIFMPYGRTMNTDTFNHHLKRACEACGVVYHSSHKIRFYAASSAFTGDNIVEIGRQMGQKHVSTTMRYLRNVNQTATDKASLFKALGRTGAEGAEG